MSSNQQALLMVSSPQGQFCIPDPYYICNPIVVERTSALYPTLFGDDMDVSHAAIGGVLAATPLESMIASHAVTGGELRDVIKTYSLWPIEELEVTAHAAENGELRTVLLTYQNWPTEELDVSHAATGGTLS